MKKVINLSLLLLVLLLPVTALAHDFEVDGIFYLMNGNNATVTYKGTSYSEYSNEYTGDVVIPETVTYDGTTYTVTSIRESAFQGCKKLTSLTIPNTVTTIGSSTLRNCSGLMSINIENGNPNYDSRENCNAIIETATNTLIAGCMNTTIPNNVTSLDNYSFFGCSGLTSVTIPNTVTTIGEYTFYGCSGLTNLIIPNSVTSIGSYAFYNCSGLTSVTISNSVTTIDNNTFHGCSGLTSIEIPNSVTTIGVGAFYDCTGLTSITIPNSVTSIGNTAFTNCSGLMSIDVENGNPNYDSRNNCNAIIETATNTLIAGCMNTTIPNSVTTIGKYAFSHCSSLTSVFIPNSVTTIGYAAFSHCSSLTSVTIPNSVTTIDKYAFYGCGRVTSVTIPNSVTTIGDYAFSSCVLYDVFSFIEDPTTVSMGSNVFLRYPINPAERTLHVPVGTVSAYQAIRNWSDYFGSIVEMEPAVVPGDVNGDGELGIADVTALINYLLTGDTTGISPDGLDCNQDGEVGIADVADLINFLLTGNW